MAIERSADPPRGRSSARVQPENLDGDEPESEHLDRLLGDAELLTRLQLSGYADDDWQPVAAEFARYGLGVLPAWISTGRIFGEVYRATKRRLTPPEQDLDADTIHDLATDTVVASLTAFLENVLKPNRWNPAKGASLKTFFIGQCKFQFVAVYRRWQRDVRSVFDTQTLDNEAPLPPTAGADQPVLAKEAWEKTLGLLTTQTARDALALQDQGYSHDEIAEILDLRDARAVTNLLHHQRRVLGRRAG